MVLLVRACRKAGGRDSFSLLPGIPGRCAGCTTGADSLDCINHPTIYFVSELVKIDKFELAKVGQATEHNYCGVNCGIMDEFASVFGKAGSLIRLDCRSLEYQYFPFHPEGYRLVLMLSLIHI